MSEINKNPEPYLNMQNVQGIKWNPDILDTARYAAGPVRHPSCKGLLTIRGDVDEKAVKKMRRLFKAAIKDAIVANESVWMDPHGNLYTLVWKSNYRYQLRSSEGWMGTVDVYNPIRLKHAGWEELGIL